ncbi:hypothetical protein FB451DRAFT_1445621 [Mycena latifolia]|nr:hypothetical protein FB451DRAFT_1445621 [Mycena latifolia]
MPIALPSSARSRSFLAHLPRNSAPHWQSRLSFQSAELEAARRKRSAACDTQDLFSYAGHEHASHRASSSYRGPPSSTSLWLEPCAEDGLQGERASVALPLCGVSGDVRFVAATVHRQARSFSSCAAAPAAPIFDAASRTGLARPLFMLTHKCIPRQIAFMTLNLRSAVRSRSIVGPRREGVPIVLWLGTKMQAVLEELRRWYIEWLPGAVSRRAARGHRVERDGKTPDMRRAPRGRAADACAAVVQPFAIAPV